MNDAEKEYIAAEVSKATAAVSKPNVMTTGQADEALFWLRSGMGMQADKTFLLNVIEDLKRQVQQHEEWAKHANKEYDALRTRFDRYKAHMRAAVNSVDVEDAIGPPKPKDYHQEIMDQTLRSSDHETAIHADAPINSAGPDDAPINGTGNGVLASFTGVPPRGTMIQSFNGPLPPEPLQMPFPLAINT